MWFTEKQIDRLKLCAEAGKLVRWDKKKNNADELEKLDFGCDFKDGVCAEYRGTARGPKCCCVSCKSTLGYLGAIPPGSINEYAKFWDQTNGFWSDGKDDFPVGCRLPRWMRSKTCDGHFCSARVDRTLVNKIMILSSYPAKRIKLIEWLESKDDKLIRSRTVCYNLKGEKFYVLNDTPISASTVELYDYTREAFTELQPMRLYTNPPHSWLNAPQEARGKPQIQLNPERY